MPPVEAIRLAPPPAQLRSQLILRDLVSVEAAQANLFEAVTPAETLLLPDYLGHPSAKIVAPSLKLESPLGNEARLVNMAGSNPQLDKLYQSAQKGSKNSPRIIEDKTYEAAIRILDTNGADGLHHIHNTVFPRTVYFIAKVGSGLLTNVYLTDMGSFQTPENRTVPVLAFLTATKDKKSEYDFFKLVGAGMQKGKYNH